MPCPVCGSQRLSPPAALTLPAHSGGVTAAWADASKTGFIRTGIACTADRVVVCGDCGYFLLFASPAALRSLHEHWNQLVPATP